MHINIIEVRLKYGLSCLLIIITEWDIYCLWPVIHVLKDKKKTTELTFLLYSPIVDVTSDKLNFIDFKRYCEVTVSTAAANMALV